MSILRIAILFALIALSMTAQAQDDLDRALIPKSSRAKSYGRDQVAGSHRGSSLGAVVFELSGGAEKRRLVEDG